MRIGRRAWIAGSLALTALSLTGLHANPDKVNDLYLESCAACHGSKFEGDLEATSLMDSGKTVAAIAISGA